MATTRVDIGYGRHTYSPQNWFSNFTSGPYGVTSTDSRSGGPVMNWKVKIRLATDATGNYTRSVFKTGLVRGSYNGRFYNTNIFNPNDRWTDERVDGVLTNSGSAPPSPPSVPSNDIDTRARIAFLKNVRKTQRQFQGGVFLGELRETIHMIARPASALRRAVTSYSSAAKKAARRAKNSSSAAKAVSGTWLEHSYGWRPLFADIDQGMSALAALPRVQGQIVSGSASDRSQSAPFDRNVTGAQWNVHLFRLRCVDVFSKRVRYKGMLAYVPDLTPAQEWRQKWGLTLSDFAPTVWELIPYSFLVDYFSNIGEVIDAASVGPVMLRWGYSSTFLAGQEIVVGSKLFSGYPPQWLHQINSLSVSVPEQSNVFFQRSRVSSVSVGVTDIQLKVPGISEWRKWANIGALAVEKVL